MHSLVQCFEYNRRCSRNSKHHSFHDKKLKNTHTRLRSTKQQLQTQLESQKNFSELCHETLPATGEGQTKMLCSQSSRPMPESGADNQGEHAKTKNGDTSKRRILHSQEP